MENSDKVMEFLFYWNRPIAPGNLSEELKLKHSTLNSVLKRLQKKGMIYWEKYSKVSLTDEGSGEAAHLTNHHLIVEKFLAEVLQMSEEAAHREALMLSPHIGCEVIEAICEKMGVSHTSIDKSFCRERKYL